MSLPFTQISWNNKILEQIINLRLKHLTWMSTWLMISLMKSFKFNSVSCIWSGNPTGWTPCPFSLKVLNLTNETRLDRIWALLLVGRGSFGLASCSPQFSQLVTDLQPPAGFPHLVMGTLSDRTSDCCVPAPAVSTWPLGPPGTLACKPWGCMLFHCHP